MHKALALTDVRASGQDKRLAHTLPSAQRPRRGLGKGQLTTANHYANRGKVLPSLAPLVLTLKQLPQFRGDFLWKFQFMFPNADNFPSQISQFTSDKKLQACECSAFKL
jgi:hypothetical protein